MKKIFLFTIMVLGITMKISAQLNDYFPLKVGMQLKYSCNQADGYVYHPQGGGGYSWLTTGNGFIYLTIVGSATQDDPIIIWSVEERDSIFINSTSSSAPPDSGWLITNKTYHITESKRQNHTLTNDGLSVWSFMPQGFNRYYNLNDEILSYGRYFLRKNVGLIYYDFDDSWGSNTTLTTSRRSYSLLFNKIPGPVLTLSKSSVDFGIINLNSFSDTSTITLLNSGQDTLVISKISVSTKYFQILNSFSYPLKLAGKESIDMKIMFVQKTDGLCKDSITIISNDSNNPLMNIRIEGVGILVSPEKFYAAPGSTNNAGLYTLNSVSGLASFIAAFDTPQITSMRVHPTTEILIGYYPSLYGGDFYKISSDGKLFFKLKGQTNIPDLKGMAFINDSIVYMGAPNGIIYRININNGSTFPDILLDDFTPGGLAINPLSNELWMTSRSLKFVDDAIYKVDRTTRVVTMIGSTGVGENIRDIIFGKNGKLYGLFHSEYFDSDKLYIIDTANGIGTFIGLLNTSNILCIALHPKGLTIMQSKLTDAIPKHFVLEQNYPNPFNLSTIINYQLPVNSIVKLKVYDVVGREVATLVNERQEAGIYQSVFNALGLSSGIYFYHLSAGNYSEVNKMMFIK